VVIAGSLGNASSVGYLYAAMGGCAVLVGFVMLRRRTRLVTRDIIVGFAVLEVIGLALLTVHGAFWAACLALALSGGTAVVWQTYAMTDVQMRANPVYLGRVNAVMVVSMTSGMLVGALLALALVPWAGWERTLFIACCLSLLVLAAGVVFGPQQSEAAD
jgi:predicted MFS family arabinose efflux permease